MIDWLIIKPLRPLGRILRLCELILLVCALQLMKVTQCHLDNWHLSVEMLSVVLHEYCNVSCLPWFIFRSNISIFQNCTKRIESQDILSTVRNYAEKKYFDLLFSACCGAESQFLLHRDYSEIQIFLNIKNHPIVNLSFWWIYRPWWCYILDLNALP